MLFLDVLVLCLNTLVLLLGLLMDTNVSFVDSLVLFVDTSDLALFVDPPNVCGNQISPFKSLPLLPTHQTNPHARILTFDTCFLDILDQSDILKPH